jgi:hypothetical protein
MKAISLVFVLFILGCSNEQIPNIEPNNIPQELIGKWKIVEVYETDGASKPQWRNKNTGSIYDYWFKIDNSFLQSDGIYEGTYSVDSNMTLKLTINSSNSVKIETLNLDTLVINYLNFEPFKYKFRKVSSETE